MSRLALSLVLVASSAAAGCGASTADPEQSARAFISAVRSRNAQAVLGHFDEATRDHFTRMAELATDRVGGRRVIEAHELLQVVSVDPTFDVERSELISQDETHARVELTSPAGDVQIVSLKREKGAWRVELPALLEPAPVTPEAAYPAGDVPGEGA